MKALSKYFVLATTAVIASGCTSARYEPVIDGEPNARYAADIAECRALADQHRNTADDAKSGALVGAGIGAIAGALDGGETLAGAAIGAAFGSLGAAEETAEKNQRMVFECMRGRGHAVVG